jgi:hypothetical protein
MYPLAAVRWNEALVKGKGFRIRVIAPNAAVDRYKHTTIWLEPRVVVGFSDLDLPPALLRNGRFAVELPSPPPASKKKKKKGNRNGGPSISATRAYLVEVTQRCEETEPGWLDRVSTLDPITWTIADARQALALDRDAEPSSSVDDEARYPVDKVPCPATPPTSSKSNSSSKADVDEAPPGLVDAVNYPSLRACCCLPPLGLF